jgi:predicted phage-related endonuclease
MLVEDRPRTDFLGASELGAILSFDPFQTGKDVWLKKTHRQGERPKTGDTERGILLEPVVRDSVMPGMTIRDRGEVLRVDPPEPGMMFVDDEADMLGAHPDGGIQIKDSLWPTGAWELKCPTRMMYDTYREQGLGRQYVLQLNSSIGLSGRDWGAFTVHCADSWETLTFPLEFDQEVYDFCRSKGAEWWEKFVVTDTPPPEFFDVGTEPDYPELKGEAVFTQDDELIAMVRRFAELKEMEKRVEALLKGEKGEDAEPGLTQQLLEAVEATGFKTLQTEEDGKVVVITNKGRTIFDQDAVALIGALDPVKVAGSLDAYLAMHDIKGFIVEDVLEILATMARLDVYHDPRVFKQTAASRYPRHYPRKR